MRECHNLLEAARSFGSAWGFIFDMDGLIFDTERIFMEQLAVVMAQKGYRLSRKVYCRSRCSQSMAQTIPLQSWDARRESMWMPLQQP